MARGTTGRPGGPCGRSYFGGGDTFRYRGGRLTHAGCPVADGIHRGRRAGGRTQLGQDRGTDGRAQPRLRCGDNRRLQPLRQPAGDQRDAGTTADRRDRGQPAGRNPIALQRLSNTFDEPLQWLRDKILELVAGQPNVRSDPGKVGRDDADRRHRQLFLGAAALGQPTAQRRQRRRAGGVDAGARRDVTQDRLVKTIAGEVGKAQGRRDLTEVGGRIGHGDAAAARAEVAQHHDPVLRKSGLRVQRRQRGRAIANERRRRSVGRQGRVPPQCRSQCRDLALVPMPGHCDGERRPIAGRARHPVERGGGEHLAGVGRPIDSQQRIGVTDPLDESAQQQAGFVQSGILIRGTYLRRAVVEQRQHRAADHRGAARPRGHQGCRPDRQAERVVHVSPIVLPRWIAGRPFS